MWCKQLIWLTVMILGCMHVAAQVQFTASVSPNPASTNSFITLEYTISGSNKIDHLYPPDFKSFRLISGPSSRSSVTRINGKASRNFAVAFVLQPTGAGSFLIPGATAVVDGQQLESNSITLDVKKEDKPLREVDDFVLLPGENPAEKIRQNMHLVLETDKSSAYVGEPVTATYKLYSRLKSSVRLSKNPSFNGFSVIDLQHPSETESYRAMRNGIPYQVYVVRKVKLFPLQSGNIEIGSLELENEVHFYPPTETTDPFELFEQQFFGGYLVQDATLTSKSVQLKVLELPAKDKPENFSGAVGSYQVNASVNSKTINANEEGKLRLTITGTGNFNLLTPPAIQWPQGLEYFEPEIRDSASGKIFTFPFSSVSAGEYIIPPVSFSYFDPEKEKYITASTAAIPITVKNGVTAPAPESLQPATASNNEFPWWIIVIIVSAALIGVLMWQLRKGNQKTEPVIAADSTHARKERVVTDPLEKAAVLLNGGDRGKFYTELNRSLKHFLASEFCSGAAVESIDHLRQCMDDKNVPNKIVLETQDLLKEIELELYTPFHASGGERQHLERARVLVNEISYLQRV